MDDILNPASSVTVFKKTPKLERDIAIRKSRLAAQKCLVQLFSLTGKMFVL